MGCTCKNSVKPSVSSLHEPAPLNVGVYMCYVDNKDKDQFWSHTSLRVAWAVSQSWLKPPQQERKKTSIVTFQKRTKLLPRTRMIFGMYLACVPSKSSAERHPSFLQGVSTRSLSHWPRYQCRQKRPAERGKKSHCHLLVLYKWVKHKRKQEHMMEERPLWAKSCSSSTRIIK